MYEHSSEIVGGNKWKLYMEASLTGFNIVKL